MDNTIAEAEKYAKGKVWSRVIWDVTAIGWLMNDDQKLMLDRLEATPVPEYDHRYTRDPSRRPCKMVYHVNRDALLSDLFEHIRGN